MHNAVPIVELAIYVKLRIDISESRPQLTHTHTTPLSSLTHHAHTTHTQHTQTHTRARRFFFSRKEVRLNVLDHSTRTPGVSKPVKISVVPTNERRRNDSPHIWEFVFPIFSRHFPPIKCEKAGVVSEENGRKAEITGNHQTMERIRCASSFISTA